jgi:CRP/FNR family cyclic AMP-dependent transcriptional regulator
MNFTPEKSLILRLQRFRCRPVLLVLWLNAAKSVAVTNLNQENDNTSFSTNGSGAAAGQALRTLEDPLRYLRISAIQLYAPGAAIYSSGDPAINIYLVISGRVRVGRRAENGREVAIAIYETDDVFGESALIQPKRTGCAVALEDTKVMLWTAAQIEAVGNENPRLFLALLQSMTKRLNRFEKRIESFMVESAQARLARALIELAGAGRDAGGEPVHISHVTHELLASYVGTTREVVTLFMNQFRRRNYLTYSRKGITIYPDCLWKVVLGEEAPSVPLRRSQAR